MFFSLLACVVLLAFFSLLLCVHAFLRLSILSFSARAPQLSLTALSTPFPGLELRQLSMRHAPSNTQRTIRHYCLTAWADHSVPTSPEEVLRFLKLLRAQPSAGPVVVHCSAGIGRTGTLVAIDVATRKLHAALQSGDAAAVAEAVALDELLLRLRRQRQGMVQTAEQYVFCYKALLAELEGLE